MVNVCGHPLCEGCVDLLFLKGTGNCYECNQPLRRGNFKEQLFDDSNVEKEVEIRKKLLKEYNKVEEDFNTLEEYNNYLEEFEEIVFNLCNNIEILETNKRIENYKKLNRDQIMKNKIRLGKAERELCLLIEEEKEEEARKRSQMFQLELESKKRKVATKEALIDELTFATEGAKDIVSVYASRMNQPDADLPPLPSVTAAAVPKHFSSGIRIGTGSGLYVPPIVKVEEGPLYVYEPTIKTLDGPQYPSRCELTSGTYLRHVRQETLEEKAGGYVSCLAVMRALADAFASLYHTNKKPPPAISESPPPIETE